MAKPSDDIWNRTLVIYLAISTVSALVATLVWFLGDNIAEVAGQSEYGLSFKAGGSLAAFIIVMLISNHMIIQLDKNKSNQSLDEGPTGNLPETYSFSVIYNEIFETLERLEENDNRRLKFYVAAGDRERVMEGIFNSILYLSLAAPTGQIDPRFYGNMLCLSEDGTALRLRHYVGPYNEEILSRSFPLTGRAQGVASEAVRAEEPQVRNKMSEELKDRGEARLAAMVSVPVPTVDTTHSGHDVLVINIDSGVPAVFPDNERFRSSDFKNRLDMLVALTQRANALNQKSLDI